MCKKNEITLLGLLLFTFSTCYCWSIAFGQKHSLPNRWRIVVFDFKTENIPSSEASFFESEKVNFPGSIADKLKKQSIDVLERELLPDVHKEVTYAKDNQALFDPNTRVEIKTKGGNAGLVGMLVYESSGKIKLITRVVNIETSSLIASDERAVFTMLL